MLESLQCALSSKLSERPRINVIACDTGPSLFMELFIQEALTNCFDVAEVNKLHVHFVMFANDITPFQTVEKYLTTYDFVTNPCINLDKLYGMIVSNVGSKLEKNHCLIIDDYALFSVLCSCRDIQRQSNFLRMISKKVQKTFLFCHQSSLTTNEIGIMYDIASDIAFIRCLPGMSSTGDGSTFSCDLLKIRTDRRVTYERSIFQVSNHGIMEQSLNETTDKMDRADSSEVFKNLTTFKLTLEDDERESKSKLHLPYFEAQKTSLDDPDNYDDFDDDEEDEEV